MLFTLEKMDLYSVFVYKNRYRSFFMIFFLLSMALPYKSYYTSLFFDTDFLWAVLAVVWCCLCLRLVWGDAGVPEITVCSYSFWINSFSWGLFDRCWCMLLEESTLGSVMSWRPETHCVEQNWPRNDVTVKLTFGVIFKETCIIRYTCRDVH